MKSYQVGDTTYQFPDEYTDDQATAVLQKTGVIGAPKDYAPPVPRPALPWDLSKESDASVGGGANEPGIPSFVGSGVRQLWNSIPAFANDPKRATSDVIEGAGKVASPLAIPALISNPVTTIGGLLGGWAGSEGASKAVTNMGADPETARLVGNIASLPAAALGGAAFESPKVQGFASGAAQATPKTLLKTALPAVLGYGRPVAPYADALTVAASIPPIYRGGMAGAEGKPWTGPTLQGIIDAFTPARPPEALRIAAPVDTSYVRGVPAEYGGQRALPPATSLLQGQDLGSQYGDVISGLPVGRNLRPASEQTGFTPRQQPRAPAGSVWRQGMEPVPQGAPGVVPDITPQSADLPKGLLDDFTVGITDGRIKTFDSKALTPQEKQTIMWMAKGGAKAAQEAAQPAGLLASDFGATPTTVRAKGLLGNPQMPTPPQVRQTPQAAVPLDPNAELRTRLQKGGTPDSVQNAINKVNAVSDYLKSNKFQQWDAKPDLKNISKADLQRVYDQAYQHAVENKNPTLPAKGYKNPDPTGSTWQEILRSAGMIQSEAAAVSQPPVTPSPAAALGPEPPDLAHKMASWIQFSGLNSSETISGFSPGQWDVIAGQFGTRASRQAIQEARSLLSSPNWKPAPRNSLPPQTPEFNSAFVNAKGGLLQ
jgi:hypothetical protein